MKSVGRNLIILSLFLAIICTFVVVVYLQSLNAPKELAKKTTILIAVNTIPQATLIDKKMLKEVEVPDNSIFNDYIKDNSKIVGKYTKDTIIKGEGFRTQNLISQDGNDITININSKQRAVSINVTGDSGVSDLLKSGDFVDVIAYLPEKKEQDKIVRADIAKVILQNLKVLAVNKELNRDQTTAAATGDTKDKVPPTFLVTLSVPFNDVEKLVLSENIGSLKLSLRPLNKETNVDTKGSVWQDLMINSVGSQADNNSIDTTDNKNSNTVIVPNKFVNYIIKSQDSLRSISFAFYGDSEKYMIIKQANNIQDENQIVTGNVIKIPVSQ